MRKIILPPILLVFCIAGIYLTGHMEGATFWHSGNWNYLGYGVLLLGLLLPVWGARVFKQHETNILPYKDPDSIVTDGPFKFTRNPMYLGMLLVTVAANILVATPSGLLFSALYFAVANWWYIPYEEGRMQEIFGDTFEDYKGSVRRWV
ncbi:MAG: isoprenylcysteine carboxylmethyltransferase family protein [Kordiimonadaceae bacterium]|nr:isoprenylcysteine carboxylmethyltransferase family protein [Kordiimonadaceae bacterium]